jgi:hypothetical protein
MAGEDVVLALHATTDAPGRERGGLAGWAEPRLVAADGGA